MSGRHFISIVGFLGFGVLLACSSSGSGGYGGDGGPSGSGGAGGGGSATPCNTFAQIGQQCTSLVSCLQTNCSAQMTQCYGASWASGSVTGGTCAVVYGCQQACNPCTQACADNCYPVGGSPCETCESDTVGACAMSKCMAQLTSCPPAMGGTGAGGSTGAGGGSMGTGGGSTGTGGGSTGTGGGSTGTYTCADLQACCAKASSTLQAACTSAYNTVASSGDAACSIVLSTIKSSYCP